MFGILRGNFGQFLAPLFIQFGDRQHDDRAVGLRVDAKSALANGFLDLADQRLVPDIDGHHARLGDVDGADLVDRRHLSVGLDLHRLDHRGRSAAGSQRCEFVTKAVHCAFHPALQIVDVDFEVLCHVGLPLT